jgi:hypothetical protein
VRGSAETASLALRLRNFDSKYARNKPQELLQDKGRISPEKRAISNDVGGVKSFLGSFLLLIIKVAQTSASTHEWRPFLTLLFICVTRTCSARLGSSARCCPPAISSITIDHDELFELPVGRQVA